jgi:hypothetical protein
VKRGQYRPREKRNGIFSSHTYAIIEANKKTLISAA